MTLESLDWRVAMSSDFRFKKITLLCGEGRGARIEAGKQVRRLL